MTSREDALRILKEEGCEEKIILHCMTVADVALEIAQKNIEMGREVDLHLVEIGGLLHDLGRAKTHDMTHALVGMELAKKHGVDEPVLEIIKKHIGAGITRREAAEFGLPADDYIPRTWEEKIVAHADNLVKGKKIITLEKRNKLLIKNGVDDVFIKRINDLADEVDPDK